jgi:hypothetical protein
MEPARPGARKSPSADSSLSAETAATYGALLRVPGFGRIYTSLLIGRVSGQMVTVTLVLFVLGRYHSPTLALVAALFPLLTSPPAMMAAFPCSRPSSSTWGRDS